MPSSGKPQAAIASATVAPAGITTVAARCRRGQAVFGELVAATQPLRDGDRLELLAPLSIDPKEARRRRAKASSAAKPKP